MEPLPPSFFDRHTVEVARDLLGKTLIRDEVQLRIVETEAYRTGDSACHAWRGRTDRNAPMWGPPGHAYVYLCYGLHHLLNLVTEEEGVPGAVLIRAGVVLAGEETVRQRRGGRLDCAGPGTVGQALGLDRGWSGRSLTPAGGLFVVDGSPPQRIRADPRVGIGYASLEDQALPWRFREALSTSPSSRASEPGTGGPPSPTPRPRPGPGPSAPGSRRAGRR